MKYVTHDDTGALTGAYIQDLHPDHEGIYIEATDDQLTNWVRYQANANFDGLELAPPPAIIPPTAEQIIAEVTAATQKRLDDFAKTRNYDGILSACTYATSSVPKFAAEGQYAVDKRDQTWAALYAFMADVQEGLQTMPAGFEDVEPLLPSLNWPV